MASPAGSCTRRRRRIALVLSLFLLVEAWGPLAEASPLTKPEVLKLVRKNVQEVRLLAVVRELGIGFKVTTEVADELRAAGATASLIAALQGLASSNEPAASQPAESSGAPPPPPAPAPPPAPSSPPEAPPPPVLALVVTPSPPAPPPTPITTPPAQPAPAPPPTPITTPPAQPAPAPPVAASGPRDTAPSAGDPPPRDELPPAVLELPPASPLPRGARETMVALIPGPPPPPPPPVLGATSGLAETPAPRPPAPPATAAVPAAPPAPPPAPAAPPPSPPPAASEPPSRWEQVRPLLEKAQALAAEGDVRGAQTLVVKAMEMDPGEPQVWKTFKGIEQDLLVRAETFLADGQLPRALREFQFIISTNPESALGFNGMGQALLQLKNYAEAVAAFEKALGLEPGNARYRQALTRARSLQRASKALERQGQQNLKDMIEDQPGKKKGP